ncbi:adenylosuccinate synthase [Ruminococcaceae bacterium YRB3002]|nr:adenylosuccinate synthase [Ruminococcaceae bacterium YRB3002]
MAVFIVIGKNFGDEGKGLATDYFAMRSEQSGRSAVVVRHNGGAQAGHTVDLHDSRFVFHELSSGSFRHADTYWTGTFLPDLYKLREELTEFLHAAGFVPGIFADGSARCVTILDVLMNQALEYRRGDERHGSCGMGIDETVRRSDTEFVVRLSDICSYSASELTDKLIFIRDNYIPVRLDQLGLTLKDLGRFKELFSDDIILYNWSCEAVSGAGLVTLRSPDIIREYDDVIFEGAQGLLLDSENTRYAPHLTTSRTGLTNPVKMIRDLMPDEERDSEAVYVTRSYVTRHGNGPLPNESDICFSDRTNMPNEWQGTIRFAHDLPWEQSVEPVRRDIEENEYKGRPSAFVTHLNEIDDNRFRAAYESSTPFAEDVVHIPYNTGSLLIK